MDEEEVEGSKLGEGNFTNLSIFGLRLWMRRSRVRILAKAIYEFINFSNVSNYCQVEAGSHRI